MTDALPIAGLGILVTFTGLSLLALLVWAIGAIDVRRRQALARRTQAAAKERFDERDQTAGGDPSPELVAVITAAVEAAGGRRVRVRHVRYLRPLEEDEGAWTRIGRLQVMGSHAVVRRTR